MFITCFLLSEFASPYLRHKAFPKKAIEPIMGLEPMTSSLPRMRSTTELYRHSTHAMCLSKALSHIRPQRYEVLSFIQIADTFFFTLPVFFRGLKKQNTPDIRNARKKSARTDVDLRPGAFHTKYNDRTISLLLSAWRSWRAACGASSRRTNPHIPRKWQPVFLPRTFPPEPAS